MVGLKAFNKSGVGLDPALAKRVALFPEGRGLGVGGKGERERKRRGVSTSGLTSAAQ